MVTEQDAKRAKTAPDGGSGTAAAAPATPMEVDAALRAGAAAGGGDQGPPGPPMRSLMATYYRRLFPVQQMFKWLCYGNDGSHAAADAGFPSRRELCFTLEGDIFVRYQSYKTAAELAADLARKVPTKIDIGPVYSHDPRQRAKYAKDFKPLQREFVMDIDLTDYDELRTCGSGGHICSRCWPFMAAAIQVLDAALRADFGFRHILWVYSGRRGVHCWVADDSARSMADDVRASVVGYLSVIRGSEGGLAKLGYGRAKHPALARAEAALAAAFRQTILPQQALLEEPEAIAALLRYVPDDELRGQLAAAWAAGGQGIVPSGGGRRTGGGGGGGDACCLSVRRWDELQEKVAEKRARAAASKDFARAAALERCVSDIVFAYSYPRLDVEVSKKMNHLLKAPFCVHPKTGKVCVPIDPAAAWDFDPDGVPTVQQLVEQLADAAAAQAGQPQQQQGQGQGDQAEAWRGTDLARHISFFADTFLAPLASSSRAALNERAKAAAAEARAGPASMAW